MQIVGLGVIQGLTEFLPVSSSGHLVAARVLLGIPDISGNSFDAFLHLGTLLSVLVYYAKVWVGMLRSVVVRDKESRDKRQLAAKLAAATIPAAVVGYMAQSNADQWRSPMVVALGLLFTAGVLLMTEKMSGYLKFRAIKLDEGPVESKRAGWRDAIVIGLAQTLALVPGVSRSGMTIAAGQLRGLSRKQAVDFSFLLSAPIIAGAGLFSLSSLVMLGEWKADELAVGFIASFVTGWLAIWLLLKMVQRWSLVPFAIYLVILAGVLLLIA